MVLSSITRNATVITLFALGAAALIAAIYQGTRERIVAAERLAEQRALFEVLPSATHDNDLLASTQELSAEAVAQLHLPAGTRVHIARRAGKPVAVVVPSVAPDGYSGAIRLLVGIFEDGTVSGVRVLNHRETPGLGDRIELAKSNWILGFAGRSLTDPDPEQWTVRKNGGAFDQFTGATITPRAVVEQVAATLRVFNNQRAQWLDLPAPEEKEDKDGNSG